MALLGHNELKDSAYKALNIYLIFRRLWWSFKQVTKQKTEKCPKSYSILANPGEFIHCCHLTALIFFPNYHRLFIAQRVRCGEPFVSSKFHLCLSLQCCVQYNTAGLVQDCSISIANALEILQSCTKPSLCHIGPCYTRTWTYFIINLLYPFLFIRSWKGGILVSRRPSICPTACGQNRVHSVTSTILVGSISYLHILSSNFRRCVACRVF